MLAGLARIVVRRRWTIVIVWIALLIPIFFAARLGVVRYRATVGERIRQTRIYHTIVASQAYNVYRWFRP